MTRVYAADGYMINALRPGTSQLKAFTTSTAVDNAFGAETRVVRVVVNGENAYVEFGAAPTATASSMLMVQDVPEYFIVNGGDKVAALQTSTGGTIYVTEMQ